MKKSLFTIALALACAAAQAQTLTTLAEFNGANGSGTLNSNPQFVVTK